METAQTSSSRELQNCNLSHSRFEQQLRCDVTRSDVTTKDHNSRKENSSTTKHENDVIEMTNLDGSTSTFQDYDLRENGLERTPSNLSCGKVKRLINVTFCVQLH